MIIIATAELSGPAKGVLQLLEALRLHEIPFFLYNFRVNGDPQEKFIRAAHRRDIDVFFLEQRGKSYLSILLQARKEVRSKSINIVQTHGFKPSFIGFVLKYLCRVRWICFLHGTTTENLKVRIYHLLDQVLQFFAHRVILVSEAQRRRLFGGGNEKRVRVLHNAIDPEQPVRVSADDGHGGPPATRKDGNIWLVAVGRLSPEKGFDILMRAFARLVHHRSDLRLVLVGDGQERRDLVRLARRLGVEDLVIFTGYSETPGDYMKQADIVILPSRSEGIPNVALEAMALCKPVVATRVGGTPEVIRHDREGLLVAPGDPEALALAVERLLNDPAKAEMLARNGRERIRADFSPEKRVGCMLALYRELLSNSPV